jgi:hypothetical protein
MATAMAVETLEEAAARLRVKRNALDTLTRELETATHEAESLRLLREKFLIPASAGDQAALAHVQELEQRQIAVGRKIEGFTIRVQAADREFHEVEQEHVTISRQIGEARAVARAKEIFDEAMRQAHNVQALFRQTCRAEYDLCEYLRTNVEFGAELSEPQKSTIVTAVREKLAVIVVNEGWTQSHCNYGAANLVLRNACAPDSLKHLEVLK